MAFSFQSPAPQSPFHFTQTPQPAASSPFQFSLTPQPATQSLFQFSQTQQQQQPQALPAQQQVPMLLFTKDRSPAGYGTKWDELHPDSQKLLLQIEERIREYKDESERLDQCSRLYDSSVSSHSFESDIGRVVQELRVTLSAIERENVSVHELINSVKGMMWNTEFAVRSYMMLRQRFIRPAVVTESGGGSANVAQPATSAPFYGGIPKRPSPFLRQTVARFESYLEECCKWVEELEQLLKMDSNKRFSDSVAALPKVMSNVHDYFVHVAAKVENLHQYIESMKTAYLYNQRRRGDGNNPFLEANRREAAKQEAASRRVHPTLHLPRNAQQAITGSEAPSPAPASSQPLQLPAPSSATSGSSFPSFTMPAAVQSSSSFPLSTPAPAQSSSFNLFSSSGLATPFATPSASLFASTAPASASSTPAFASTPALGPTLFSTPTFGTASSTPAFASTPAATPSLFSTPTFGTGGAAAPGASFGTGNKTVRPKNRSTRR